MTYRRRCGCGHGYPLCACDEGHAGEALLTRSRWLSHLAGWPMRVDREAAEAVMRQHGRPRHGLNPGWPTWLASPRVVPTVGLPEVTAGCGCGGKA